MSKICKFSTRIFSCKYYYFICNLNTILSGHSLHSEKQLQRAWPPPSLLGHGRPRLLLPLLLRREGRAGHGLLQHTGLRRVARLHHPLLRQLMLKATLFYTMYPILFPKIMTLWTKLHLSGSVWTTLDESILLLVTESIENISKYPE